MTMPTTKAGHNKEGKTMISVRDEAIWMDWIDPHWFKKITLDTLDMNDPENCILGQLYGDYHVGANVIVEAMEFAIDWSDITYPFGGNCPEGYELQDYCRQLGDSWEYEILMRLAGEKKPSNEKPETEG